MRTNASAFSAFHREALADMLTAAVLQTIEKSYIALLSNGVAAKDARIVMVYLIKTGGFNMNCDLPRELLDKILDDIQNYLKIKEAVP